MDTTRVVGLKRRTGARLSPWRRGQRSCADDSTGSQPEGIPQPLCGEVHLWGCRTQHDPAPHPTGRSGRDVLLRETLARCLAFKHQSKIDLQRPPRTPSPGYSPKEWRQRTPVLTASMGMRRKEMVVPVELAHCMAEAGLARLPSINAQMLMHKPRRNREPRACMLLVSVLHRRSL